MARIFTEGAEMRDILFFDGHNNLPVATVVNTTPYLSDWYYYIATGGSRYSWRNLPAAISECYTRTRIRTNVVDTALRFTWFRTVGTAVAWVGQNALGQWTAEVTTVGVVGTSVPAMLVDTWYLLEVYFKEANAPNGRFVVKIDGNTLIDFTGDTQPAAATTFDNVAWMGGTGAVLLIDDMALNDTAGGSDDSWIGEGVVSKITPDGNGTHNNWHGSDGDDVDNYLLCDEYPNDGDVTYNYHDGAAAGTQQQFALSDWSGAGKSVLRIYAEARARKTSAVAHTIKLGELAAGGVDVVSAGRTLYTGGYIRTVGDEATVNPVSGIAWVEADLDALEFVAEVG